MVVFELHGKRWEFDFRHPDLLNMNRDEDDESESVTTDGFQYTQTFLAIIDGKEAENVLIVDDEECEVCDENGNLISKMPTPGFIMRKASRGYEQGVEDAKRFMEDENYAFALPWLAVVA